MKTSEERSVEYAKILIAKGHQDPEVLRELLICTTDKYSYPIVIEYFRNHLNDKMLLNRLFAVALEGDDSGDAPWAAANIIAEFPAKMLSLHKDQLLELAAYEWVYLKTPAQAALKKLSENAT
jgi:hypothetical protein